MKIQKIVLQDFRCFEYFEMELEMRLEEMLKNLCNESEDK